MKKSLYYFPVLALGTLMTAGTLRAAPVGPLCPKHETKCVQKADGMYCNVVEEVMVNKLVPGRTGQWGFERTPSFREISEKCPGMK